MGSDRVGLLTQEREQADAAGLDDGLASTMMSGRPRTRTASAALDGVDQVAHLRRRDRQRPGRTRAVQAQAELQLPGRDPLPRRSLQPLQLRPVVRRPQVLDLA